MDSLVPFLTTHQTGDVQRLQRETGEDAEIQRGSPVPGELITTDNGKHSNQRSDVLPCQNESKAID